MNGVSLEKGIVHLMLPFRLRPGTKHTSVVKNDIWVKADRENIQFDFLLEHVREFFTRNFMARDTDESACIILKLRTDAVPVKLFNNRIYWISNRPLDGSNKSDNTFRLPVFIDPLSFRIIYYPFAGICILIYSVELARMEYIDYRPTLSDFIKLNYLLRIFYRHDEAYFISHNERSEEKTKATHLLNLKYPAVLDIGEGDEVITKGWRPSHLINFLICEINNNSKVEFFNHSHFVPFCYFQPVNEMTEVQSIQRSIFYLRNVYDFDYTPGEAVVQSHSEFFQPFKQIFYAASLEGAVIINNSSPKDPEFIRTFYSNSFKNSLWVVILGLMQRSIVLQLMKEVSDVDPDDHKKIKEYLRRYTGMSLKALFSKISVFHQHNDFYDLIIQMLQINELQTELKDELTGLNNLQRQFHEDDVERHEIVEKQYNRRLNFILFALSVLSLAQITYAILGNESMPLSKHFLAIGIPLGLGIVMWEILKIRNGKTLE